MTFNLDVFIKATVVFLILGLLLIYRVYDPNVSGFFPPCPFVYFFDILCPGCGSQRALHHLLHLRIATAISINPMFTIAAPYAFIAYWSEHKRKKSEFWKELRAYMYSPQAIGVYLFLLFGYTVYRNL